VRCFALDRRAKLRTSLTKSAAANARYRWSFYKYMRVSKKDKRVQILTITVVWKILNASLRLALLSLPRVLSFEEACGERAISVATLVPRVTTIAKDKLIE
jgi:hypothetical protein